MWLWRRLGALGSLAALSLVLGACTGDDASGEGQPGATPSPVTSPTVTPDGAAPDSPTPAGATPRETGTQVPSLAATCELGTPGAADVEQVELAYPRGWRVTDGCQWFDPTASSVELGTEPDVAVSWRVSTAPYREAASVTDGVRDPTHYLGARSGFQASRIEGVATGRGARPEGAPVVRWLVDLDAGTDERGGVLIGTARATDAVSFEGALEALDRMARTIRATPPAVGPRGPVVVTRREGGGRPFTVTYADGCFRLRAGGPDGEVRDERCDVTPADQDGPAMVTLEGGPGFNLVAGLVGPEAYRVTAPAGAGLHAAITTPLEDAAAFAMRMGPPSLEVTVIGVDGRTLATETVTRS